MQKTVLYMMLIWFGLKSKLIYRLSSLFGLIGKFLEVLAQVLIWAALLGSGSRFDTTLAQMITYLIITRFTSILLNTSAGNEISSRIRDGSISTDFIRPLNLKAYLFCNDLGNNLFVVFVVIFPLSIIFGIGYGFLLPASWQQGVAFFVSLCFGAFIMFHYSFLLGLASFWLIQNPFLRWHFRNIEQVFSGQFFPIWFYPGWLASITTFLPFRYFTYEPIAIYLGKTPNDKIGWVLLTQLIWIFVLYILERTVWKMASQKVIVQGG